MSNNPQVANAIPAGQEDEVHREIATHINNGLQNEASSQGGGLVGMLQSLAQNLETGGGITSAIEGGLVSSLASKFGLSPMITGAIAASLPGLIHKFAQSRNTGSTNNVAGIYQLIINAAFQFLNIPVIES